MPSRGVEADLDGIDGQDKDEGQSCGLPGSGAQPWHHLHEDHSQEVQVGCAHELLQQVGWQEGQRRVLGGADAVVGGAVRSGQT